MGNVVLGKTYRDSISGYEGIATIRYDSMSGHSHYTLTRPVVEESGKIPRETFDISRLVDSKGKPVSAPEAPEVGHSLR